MNGKPLDAIFICVGGGGLLAGVAAYVKALRPEVQVIGVEADDAAGTRDCIYYNIIILYSDHMLMIKLLVQFNYFEVEGIVELILH